MAHAPTRTLLATGLLLALTSTTGCWWLGGGYDGVYFEAEDVSLELPDEGFRGSGIHGDAYTLINETSANVNDWVTDVVEATGYVIEILNQYPATDLDGSWRVYGPVDDRNGKDVAWIVRIGGTDMDTSFEFLIAPRGTTEVDKFDLMAEGNLVVDDMMRKGDMHIDFDTIEAYPDLDLTLLWTYAGDIDIDFERNVDTGEKTINIGFDEFVATRIGYLDDDVFSSDETYAFHKAGDGSGSFHLALMGEWDTYPHTWSGPEQERMQLDMVWTSTNEGRAQGTITEVDGVGDMKFGDLALDECFDAAGELTYRELTDAYANDIPGGEYNFGDATTCAVEI